MKRESKKRLTNDDLLFQEGLSVLALLSGILLISALVDAGLGPAASAPGQELRAPWIFVGAQYLLRYLPVQVAGVWAPLVVTLFLALIPFLRGSGSAGGGGTGARPLAPVIVFFVCMFLIVGVTLIGYWSIS